MLVSFDFSWFSIPSIITGAVPTHNFGFITDSMKDFKKGIFFPWKINLIALVILRDDNDIYAYVLPYIA